MSSEVVPQGPGALKLGRDQWDAALVALELEYVNAAPGATRAELYLIVTDFDDRSAPRLSASIELTQGDLLQLKGTIDAILAGLDEDDDAYLD